MHFRYKHTLNYNTSMFSVIIRGLGAALLLAVFQHMNEKLHIKCQSLCQEKIVFNA